MIYNMEEILESAPKIVEDILKGSHQVYQHLVTYLQTEGKTYQEQAILKDSYMDFTSHFSNQETTSKPKLYIFGDSQIRHVVTHTPDTSRHGFHTPSLASK